eukprot:2009628-Alexandrium_andersonii.AAC.1
MHHRPRARSIETTHTDLRRSPEHSSPMEHPGSDQLHCKASCQPWPHAPAQPAEPQADSTPRDTMPPKTASRNHRNGTVKRRPTCNDAAQ